MPSGWDEGVSGEKGEQPFSPGVSSYPDYSASRREKGTRRQVGKRAHEQPEAEYCKAKLDRRRAIAWGLVLCTVPRRGPNLAKQAEAPRGQRGTSVRLVPDYVISKNKSG